MKVPITAIALTGGLTLATWVFFYIVTPEVPLQPSGTAVVVVFYLVVVLVGRWIWRRIRRGEGDKR
jgi:hypothetical protein